MSSEPVPSASDHNAATGQAGARQDASAPHPPAAAQSAPTPSATMPLSGALAGQELVMVGVDAGRGLQRRLAEMGLLPGCRLRVLSGGRGPFVVAVKDSRLVLGHGMVGRIIVQPV